MPAATADNGTDDTPIDYSISNNWSALPTKKDPSDSVPLPLKMSYRPDTTADVFFIYPTTYFDKQLLSRDTVYSFPSLVWNVGLNNKAVNNKTDQSPILYQASIFNEAGRIYAPRYRQANYYAYFTSDTLNAAKAFDFAYQDVKRAFQFYLAHYNNGRPIIVAAHSQGTTHAKRLVKEFFENKPLMKQLVVAYLVGMPVQEDYYTGISACISPAQTGCYCSWRTFKEGYLTDYAKKERFKVTVTNPLSWETTTTPISRDENKGAVLLNFNKIMPHITGARIYNNVLWVNKPQFLGSILLRSKNYHIGDLNLFYQNVRENAILRVKAYNASSGH